MQEYVLDEQCYYSSVDLKQKYPKFWNGCRYIKNCVKTRLIPNNKYIVCSVDKNNNYSVAHITYRRGILLIEKEWCIEHIVYNYNYK